MNIIIPKDVEKIIERLNSAGYEAYVVGGCVRDSIMEKAPHDWDICTSATPEVVKSLFSHTTDYGMKHGTITVFADKEGYEITTFRAETDYSDHRHPDTVEFVADLKSDLSRRDFTINALAYNNESQLIDMFNGLDDIRNQMIRCVGNADERFKEDALRILRALRFAATLGFDIEDKTSEAIHYNVHLLKYIAKERKRDELMKLLGGNYTTKILLEYSDVIAEVIPEIQLCVGFNQNNRYHCYDVYEHMVHAVENGITPIEKFALLIHDIGKPHCYTEDKNGGHFYGHPAISEEIAKDVVNHLKFDNDSKKAVLELVKYHDIEIPVTKKSVLKLLNRLGEERALQLMDIKLADILAHAPGTQDALIEKWKIFNRLLGEVLVEGNCFSRKNLAVNGNDIKALGVSEGPEIGRIIQTLMGEVMSEQLANEKEVLLNRANELKERRD